MKILYAIQGTGNGHLSRAQEIVPIINKYAQTTVLVSGNQSQIQSNFDINYQKTGLTFLSGKTGKIDLLRTVFKSHPIDFFNEIRTFPIKQFDLVLTDFEPVAAWSALMHGVPCIEMSHQAAVIHANAPKPNTRNRLGEYILHHYCPTKEKVGFHFEAYGPHIHTPVIRQAIRQMDTQNLGHYTVYLPAYHDEVLLQFLKQFPVKWEVFSKFTKEKSTNGNVSFHPIDEKEFSRSFAHCEGVLCGAGFELPAEAMFLKKKILVIPMKGQYEQQCNAVSAQGVGATMIDGLNLLHHRTINLWLSQGSPVHVDFQDQTESIVQATLNHFLHDKEEMELERFKEKTVLEKLSVLKYLF
ncbi:MAG: glycosyltransferase family protein [Flavobacteriales bacterium]